MNYCGEKSLHIEFALDKEGDVLRKGEYASC